MSSFQENIHEVIISFQIELQSSASLELLNDVPPLVPFQNFLLPCNTSNNSLALLDTSLRSFRSSSAVWLEEP
jgi:hypothetical protein